MSEQWRGLHNPARHHSETGGTTYCHVCHGPITAHAVCTESRPCRCCLAAEVEALQEIVERAKGAYEIYLTASVSECSQTDLLGEIGRILERRPHWDDELVDAALRAAGEPSGFYALIAAVEDWHKAKQDQRDRTHSTECWRWHQECAEDMIETLRAQIQVVRECAELRLGIPVVDGTYQTGYAAAMADILRILDKRGSVILVDIQPGFNSDEENAGWADYRKEYGVPQHVMTAAHKAFLAGWRAAKDGPQDGVLQ